MKETHRGLTRFILANLGPSSSHLNAVLLQKPSPPRFVFFNARQMDREGNFKERMRNVIKKIIHADIPYFVGQFTGNHLGVMLSHLAFSKIPTVNVEAMCRDWNLGKENLYRLL